MARRGASHPVLRGIACSAMSAILVLGLLEPAHAASSATVTNAGDWPMAARDYASTRFSPLDQISPANAATLKLAFTFSTGVLRGHEAAPDRGEQHDVRRHALSQHRLRARSDAGRERRCKWKFAPKPVPASAGRSPAATWSTAALAYADGKYSSIRSTARPSRSTLKTGKPAVAHAARQHQHAAKRMTMAPLVADGRVYVGNSGGEYGVRGWVAALDEQTGKLLWRAYSTGPDNDVLIGAAFKPFYAAGPRQRSRRQELAAAMPGRSAAAPSGAGSPTTRSWISSTTAPAIPGRGMPSSAPATTSGRRASSRAIRPPARRDWFYQFAPA